MDWLALLLDDAASGRLKFYRPACGRATPPPWRYVDGEIKAENKLLRGAAVPPGTSAEQTICVMDSSVSPAETLANAMLITAAPWLLSACLEAHDFIDEYLHDEPIASRIQRWLTEATDKACGD